VAAEAEAEPPVEVVVVPAEVLVEPQHVKSKAVVSLRRAREARSTVVHLATLS
jgi:hypothetical protein